MVKVHTPDLLRQASTTAPEGVDPTVQLIATVQPRRLSKALREDTVAGIEAEHHIQLEAITRDSSYLHNSLDQIRQNAHDEMQALTREQIQGLRDLSAFQAIPGQYDARINDEIQRYGERAEAFALNKEAEAIKRALAAERGQQFLDDLKTENAVPLGRAKAAKTVQAKRDELGKRGSWILSFLPGAALGVSAIVGGLHALEHSATAVHDDTSILPGATLPGIPGAPDIRGGTIDYDVLEQNGKVTITSHGIVAQNAASGNTASNNFELLTSEHVLNRKAAAAIIDYAQKHHATITAVTARGYASDETIDGKGANLGQPSIENEILAKKRATAGVADFKAEAGQVSKPIAYDAVGAEVMLTPDQIAQIDKAARASGLSRAGLTYAYNHTERTMRKNSMASAILGKLLGANRGLAYEATLDVPQTREEPNFAYKTLHRDYFGIPGEVIAAFVGTQWGLVSTLALYGPVSGRLARHRARRHIAQAQN